jgi:hypothetical protein
VKKVPLKAPDAAPSRHCEPTGRANARPMTGSAKQSISPHKGRMDCFVASLLAMTMIASPAQILDSIFKQPDRHCEPTGRANARPMTGSAKQSIVPRKERMDCFIASLLAMTPLISTTGLRPPRRDAPLSSRCRRWTELSRAVAARQMY